MSTFDELLAILERIAKINVSTVLPFLEKKRNLRILKSPDAANIVTQVDIAVSDAILNIPEIRAYPGSFSEEKDSPERIATLTIYEIDPIDGTVDFFDTYHSSRIQSPSVLITKLAREKVDSQFKPIGGIIFDVVNEYALVSDGSATGLFSVDKTKRTIHEVKYERVEPPEWNNESVIYINRRISCPQLVFDGPFITSLRESGLKIEQVATGGAGNIALRIFRNYIQPITHGVETFLNLKPLTICFNCQPDWKTWDINPIQVIASSLGIIPQTDIFGGPLIANAAAKTFGEMHHTSGYVLSTNDNLQRTLCLNAFKFMQRNPDCSLFEKNIEYKEEIIKMVS